MSKVNFSIAEARLFCALYDLRGTVAVSKFLDIDPSVVSVGIKRFESKLGVIPLFHKISKKGKYLPTHNAENIINYMRYIVQFADKSTKKNFYSENHIIITSTHTVLNHYLGKKLKNLIFENPNLYIDLKESHNLDPSKFKVNEIGISVFIESATNKQFFPYHKFKQKLWASSEYINKYGAPASPEDLKKHRLLLRSEFDDPRLIFGSKFFKSHISENDELRFHKIHSTSLIDEMCEYGCGIMSGSEESMKIAKHKVENICPEFIGEDIDLFVCVDKEFLKKPLCRKLVNWLFEQRDLVFQKAGLTPFYKYKPLLI